VETKLGDAVAVAVAEGRGVSDSSGVPLGVAMAVCCGVGRGVAPPDPP
jgi:hypothetical protein